MHGLMQCNMQSAAHSGSQSLPWPRLRSDSFSPPDRLKIAQLCERAQLYQRALEHYTDLQDIKRVLTNTHLINAEFLLEYFGRMTPANCLDCLRDLLKFSLVGHTERRAECEQSSAHIASRSTG